MKQNKIMTIAGWILAGLIGAMMTFSASMKFFGGPDFAKAFVETFGYSADLARPIGITEIACVVIFLIPRTSVLGAVLLTGYLGGAVATHVRVHDMFIAPAIVGVCVWLSLYLRDARVRGLLPLRGRVGV